MKYNSLRNLHPIVKVTTLVLLYVSFSSDLFADNERPSLFVSKASENNHFKGLVVDANTKLPLKNAIVIITATSVKTGFRHIDIICEDIALTTSNDSGEFNVIKYGRYVEDVDAIAYLPGYEYLKTKGHRGGLSHISPVAMLRDDNIDNNNVTLTMAISSNDTQDRLLYLYEFIRTINHVECDNKPNLISINEMILDEAKSLVQSNYDRFIYHNMELLFFKRILKRKKLEALRHEIYLEGRRIRYSEHVKLLGSGAEHEIITYINSLSSSMSSEEFLLAISLERNTEHQTPLMIATRRGQEKVVRVLLDFGANPNSINRDTHGSDPEDALLIALYSYQNYLRRGDAGASTYLRIINHILDSKKYRLTPSLATRLKAMSFDVDHVLMLDAISNRHH